MAEMTKKERVNAVLEGKEPDKVPVFPFILTQGVYECGWKLPDITTQTDSDAEKCAQTVIKTLEEYDYDLALGSYMDCFYGVVPLGGTLHIPDKFGGVVSAAQYPVVNRSDWTQVKKKLPLDPWKEPRMAATLKATKMVSDQIGKDTPIAALWWPGPTAAMLMLRGPEPIIMDMIEEPDFATELLQAGNQFAIDYIRAQYQAGANSVCILGDVVGVELIPPDMCERFVLPYVAEIADMVMKEFGQKTWLHVHGNFTKPDTYPLIEKFIKEGHVHGFYLDEKHSAQWLKDNIIDKYHVPVSISIHGPNLNSWSLDEIDNFVKDGLAYAAPGGGVMVTPSCEIPSDVPKENFHKWVDSTHKYGTYPISR